ncbi:hypothetical protein G6F32_017114 [Rhizopus arrhizus]|nr:hypothetical protein G6F32_017114 [Rhizopus arrhizus]
MARGAAQGIGHAAGAGHVIGGGDRAVGGPQRRPPGLGADGAGQVAQVVARLRHNGWRRAGAAARLFDAAVVVRRQVGQDFRARVHAGRLERLPAGIGRFQVVQVLRP